MHYLPSYWPTNHCWLLLLTLKYMKQKSCWKQPFTLSLPSEQQAIIIRASYLMKRAPSNNPNILKAKMLYLTSYAMHMLYIFKSHMSLQSWNLDFYEIITILAAGCKTCICFKIVAPSLVIVTSPFPLCI